MIPADCFTRPTKHYPLSKDVHSPTMFSCVGYKDTLVTIATCKARVEFLSKHHAANNHLLHKGFKCWDCKIGSIIREELSLELHPSYKEERP